MPLPVADVNKRPVVFVDMLSPMLSDVYRAFDALFVLTSKVVAGHTRPDVLTLLEQSGMHTVADNLHAKWATPYDADSNLEDEVDAWHATCDDRTPTSFLIVTTPGRSKQLGHILQDYAVAFDGPVSNDVNYMEACRVLHSQTSLHPFNPDGY